MRRQGAVIADASITASLRAPRPTRDAWKPQVNASSSDEAGRAQRAPHAFIEKATTDAERRVDARHFSYTERCYYFNADKSWEAP